ncbi:MAG: catalase [Ruminococcaceae bacterium]|nr:catalase [Oscillospiraceae bacterium]
MIHPIKHFITITHHRHKVIAHCFRAGIGLQGLGHDLSKYAPAEFWAGARYYQGNRSPNEAEREVYGYSSAWLHHKGRNKHHFEYWTDYNPKERRVVPIRMPRRYVAEMFCDRVAASKIYRGKDYRDDDPLQYFLRGKPSRVIHPDTSDELETLLTMLAEQGEKATFSYLKGWVKGTKMGK